jgi:hypothetical protein
LRGPEAIDSTILENKWVICPKLSVEIRQYLNSFIQWSVDSYVTFALVYVNCTPEGQNRAVKDLTRIDGIVESYVTSGAYDAIIKIKADTESELREVIKAIKKTSGICSAITSIVL